MPGRESEEGTPPGSREPRKRASSPACSLRSQINFHIECSIPVSFRLNASCPLPSLDAHMKLRVIKVFGYKQAHFLVTAPRAGDRQLEERALLSPTHCGRPKRGSRDPKALGAGTEALPLLASARRVSTLMEAQACMQTYTYTFTHPSCAHTYTQACTHTLAHTPLFTDYSPSHR